MIKHYIGMLILALIVLGAIIYGFNSNGSPAAIRAMKFDSQRTSDLSTIKSQINYFYSMNGRLPTTIIEAYSHDTGGSSLKPPVDPETKENYKYKSTGKTTYQLCATFSLSSKEQKNPNGPYLNSFVDQFEHPKGNHCFDMSIDSTYTTPYVSPIPFPSANPTIPPVDLNAMYDSFFTCKYDAATGRSTKVAQIVTFYEDQTVQGIEVKLKFTAGSKGSLTVREYTAVPYPENGKVVATAQITASSKVSTIDASTNNISIIFSSPVTFSKNKAYAFVFQSDQDSTMNVYYSRNNPVPDLGSYMFTYESLPSGEYGWAENGGADIYYQIL